MADPGTPRSSNTRPSAASPPPADRAPADLCLGADGDWWLPDAVLAGWPRPQREAWQTDPVRGWLHLAADPNGANLAATTPVLAWWRRMARHYLTRWSQHQAAPTEGSNAAEAAPVPAPGPDDWRRWCLQAPAAEGLPSLSPELLAKAWSSLQSTTDQLQRNHPGGFQAWLAGIDPRWNLVGRVTFHLAENPHDDTCPFAFLATYTERLAEGGRLQHVPLGRALRRRADEADRERLRVLLEPVRAAAVRVPWLNAMLEDRSLFQALPWTPAQAHRMLRSTPDLETAGLVVRVPDWWHGGRPPRPRVEVELAPVEGSRLGISALLGFKVGLALQDETLSPEQWRQLLASDAPLVSIKGRWVEVDRPRLHDLLNHWQRAAELAASGGLDFLQGLRLLAGLPPVAAAPADGGLAQQAKALAAGCHPDDLEAGWLRINAGGRFGAMLRHLRDPALLPDKPLGPGLRATLRPYQRVGLNWLWLCYQLRIGACLADDMGLGKTLQVVALLLRVRRRRQRAAAPPEPAAGSELAAVTDLTPPSLVVVPASLLGNWRREIERFAPELRVGFAHRSQSDGRDPAAVVAGLDEPEQAAAVDAVFTSYSMLDRLPALVARKWDLVVLDEAQAIKNPDARQSRIACQLQANARLALTGTPVENSAADLWSLFHFLNPGLLGSRARFQQAVARMKQENDEGRVEAAATAAAAGPLPLDQPRHQSANAAAGSPGFAPLRRLVAPFILRRLKTDRRIITDLPDKVEMRVLAGLTRGQALLYEKTVRQLQQQLDEASAGDDPGRERAALVLGHLMRFKQICNHPAQWSGPGVYTDKDSGKFLRLRPLVADITAAGEKLLLFTQFREITSPLAEALGRWTGQSGVVLHGGTAVGSRQALVDRFQTDPRVRWFVISLKAGGTGLNLTAASHVIHFDRWWNPAVENQATDRAFRIGQTRRVMVHKFVCQGTIEERIDRALTEKQQLAGDLLEGDAAAPLISRMSDEELLQFAALDPARAIW